jgi:hypothetical protein
MNLIRVVGYYVLHIQMPCKKVLLHWFFRLNKFTLMVKKALLLISAQGNTAQALTEASYQYSG